MIGNPGRPAARDKVNAIVAADLLFPVHWHPGANLVVVIAVPFELVESQTDAELAGCGVKHAETFGSNFLADPVAGNDSYTMSGHGLWNFSHGIVTGNIVPT